MSTLAEIEDVADQIPNEMRIFAGAQCAEVTELRVRGTDLWVLLAEDEHPYTARYRPISGDPSREAVLEAITSAIDALIGARERLQELPVLRERL